MTQTILPYSVIRNNSLQIHKLAPAIFRKKRETKTHLALALDAHVQTSRPTPGPVLDPVGQLHYHAGLVVAHHRRKGLAGGCRVRHVLQQVLGSTPGDGTKKLNQLVFFFCLLISVDSDSAVRVGKTFAPSTGSWTIPSEDREEKCQFENVLGVLGKSHAKVWEVFRRKTRPE